MDYCVYTINISLETIKWCFAWTWIIMEKHKTELWFQQSVCRNEPRVFMCPKRGCRPPQMLYKYIVRWER